MRARFIVDTNVGKLARWLRMLGYDTQFINDVDDNELIAIGLNDKRVLLTRDTQIMLRRVVTSGMLKAVLIEDDNPKDQIRQVARMIKIDKERKFTRCLECNKLLVPLSPPMSSRHNHNISSAPYAKGYTGEAPTGRE